MLKWIDYIWFVGEAFHRREGSPGDGGTLLMVCWFMDAFLPLLTFSHRVVNGWWFYLVATPVLLLAPFVFCRFRYTAKRRVEIWARFHDHKHMGRRLLVIGAVMAAICFLGVFLMIHLGFWKLGSR